MFKDREQAGQKLAQVLQKYNKAKDVLVLSLPRGGVVVGAEIAKQLNFDHDIIVPRKIGAPGNPEYAIGAITQTGEGIWNEQVIEQAGISKEYLEAEQTKEKKEAQRRLDLYRGSREPQEIKGKIIILVDDGLATGLTMQAAIACVKKQEPKRLVVAIPVAPPDTIEKIKKQVDEVICLEMPLFFAAVGQFYEEFEQVSDEEVIKLLKI